MKIFKFQKDGKPVSDYEIQETIDEFLKSNKRVFKTSTCLIIHEIRARVKEKKVDYNNIRIFIDEKEWNFDKDGRSNDWAESQEVFSSILMRLL